MGNRVKAMKRPELMAASHHHHHGGKNRERWRRWHITKDSSSSSAERWWREKFPLVVEARARSAQSFNFWLISFKSW